MNDYPRLIESAFPLKQASLDSVHEKNVRHGHISTLHIWPARRPLAACRAALLATLLPDPGTPEKRKALCERIGGRVVEEVDDQGRVKEVTEGGILHWKRETENRETLEALREEILKANGGKPPQVLDPFAGGGAIPLEAMRLGCEVTASDINPVAWFILKCTLEYPQKFAGQTRPLPKFALRDREFVEDFLKKARGVKGAKLRKLMKALGHGESHGEWNEEFDFEGAGEDAGVDFDADLAWLVRAWGRWVLARARKELAHLYPTYAEYQPLKFGKPFEPQPMRLIEPDADGIATADRLNADFSRKYLDDDFNPRWVAKPAVAYLWARTVTCKACRAELPLLKTRWLCKKDKKRVRLVMEPSPDRSGVTFAIEHDVPARGGNAAQKREHDKKLGEGTMSRAGAKCPCCSAIMTGQDIRYEGRNGRLGQRMTAVVVEGLGGKEYRLPTDHEIAVAKVDEDAVQEAFKDVPFGVLSEAMPSKEALGFRLPLYGVCDWRGVFTNRQLLALASFVLLARRVRCDEAAALVPLIAASVDRLVESSSTIASWRTGVEAHRGTFSRFALSMVWDFTEVNPLSDSCGNFLGAVEWVAEFVEHALRALESCPSAKIVQLSASRLQGGSADVIMTDPPYYDAIGYSDLMDFFYVWLRRTLHGLNREVDAAFAGALSPKWDRAAQEGELIDDASRHGGDRAASKKAYEDGMARAFQACHALLTDHGRFVIVFAHKHPDAWETLVSAIVRAGFVVEGSWPIATERSARTRSLASAALASSIWLVCKKRDPVATPGWDNQVIGEMRKNIGAKLREFWDAGIRGPDFVWAATGPAMVAYSRHPVVRKANEADEILTVHEFLDEVRRIVVDFVVGRVLQRGDGGEAVAADRLDDVTAYYLLHRNDFGFAPAPSGACILYAVSCGLSDAELERTWNLVRVKGAAAASEEVDGEDAEDEGEEGDGEGRGSEFTLKTWKERNEKRMGYEAPGGRGVPLIDRVHRLMHLWREGDARSVDAYIDDNALRRHEVFLRLIQSLIELSERSNEERTVLESLSNHLGSRGRRADEGQREIRLEEESA